MDTINTGNTRSNDATGNGVTSVTTDAATPAGGTGTATPVASPPTGKARLAVGFLLRNTDAELVIAIQSILAAMTGNAAYLTPDPTLANITTALDSYIAAVSAARDSKIAVNVRKQQRAALVVQVRNLAHWVQVASNGDLPTLQSSGFPVQRQPAPAGALLPPANLKLSRGTLSGEVLARCKVEANAHAYQWRHAPNVVPTVWLPPVTTVRAKATFTGLVPGTQYAVQVSVIGRAGQSNWSDSATLIAA